MVNGYINVPKTLIDEINYKFSAVSGEAVEVQLDTKQEYLEFFYRAKNKTPVLSGIIKIGDIEVELNVVMNMVSSSFILEFNYFGSHVVFSIDYRIITSGDTERYAISSSFSTT